MAEDLFAYQLNHPLPPEKQPIYSVRPPSSSRKGRHSKKRSGRRQESIDESSSKLNDTNSKSETNNFDYLFTNENDNKTSTTKNVRSNNARPVKNNSYTMNNKYEDQTKSENSEELTSNYEYTRGLTNKSTTVNNNEYNNPEIENNTINDPNGTENDSTESEVQRYKEIALSGEDFYDIPTELLSPLMRELYNERAACLSRGLVNEAEVADNAIHICRELMTDQAKLNAMNSRQQEINNRLIEAQNELAELQETIERQERNMRIQLQRQTISMEARHQEEIDNITQEWESPERARRYNRSSAQLRQLRAQAVKLLNAHRYDEMKVVERMAEKLQADEVAASQQKWENDFNSVLRKLLGKHQMEKEKMQMAHNVQIGEYEAAKRFDLSVINKRIQNLERELAEASDSEKVWNLYHRNDVVVTTKITSGAGKKKIEQSEFSTLKLPPLSDSKSSRIPPAAALAAKTFKYSPRTPRLSQ